MGIEIVCHCAEEMRQEYRAQFEITPAMPVANRQVVKPRKCPVKPDRVHTMCVKCTEVLALDFADLTREEAQIKLKALNFPRECPGYHVELGSWDYYWQLKLVLDAMYGESCPTCGGLKP